MKCPLCPPEEERWVLVTGFYGVIKDLDFFCESPHGRNMRRLHPAGSQAVAAGRPPSPLGASPAPPIPPEPTTPPVTDERDDFTIRCSLLEFK